MDKGYEQTVNREETPKVMSIKEKFKVINNHTEEIRARCHFTSIGLGRIYKVVKPNVGEDVGSGNTQDKCWARC